MTQTRTVTRHFHAVDITLFTVSQPEQTKLPNRRTAILHTTASNNRSASLVSGLQELKSGPCQSSCSAAATGTLVRGGLTAHFVVSAMCLFLELI